MGSSSSKFKKYIQHGDEFAALQIYQSCPEVRKSLDPNLSYGESHLHNTALHYAAKHAMKHLLRIFITELGGDPNKRNSKNETGLHCCCDLTSAHRTYSAQERRASCVSLLLQWRGPESNERIDIDAQDIRGNTALHIAASNGLHRCVQLLLSHGASPFTENNDKMTACDLAVQSEHHVIARTLESTVVFGDGSGGGSVSDYDVQSLEEVYSGLKAQDLQAAKDQLLVDTSDMFNVPLFTAETLLRDNEWSREALLERWMWDAAECCRSAGVPPPSWTSQQLPHSHPLNLALNQAVTTSQPVQTQPLSPDTITCEICLNEVAKDEALGMVCRHKFCRSCWSCYLTMKIQGGDAVGTPCPAYGCSLLVPHDIIETLVSPDVATKYLQFDIKEFVERNRCIKWCPKAGCGRAVRLPEAEHIQTNDTSISTENNNISHAVDCGNGHYFCWECLGEAHAPASCNDWKRWLTKVSQTGPEELNIADSWSRSEDAANSLWLVSNSKPCPNCKSPIQKSEGCNHMKCSKCKFDFCWVCLEAWKRHGSATGGYFRCNRYEAVTKADEKQGLLINQAIVRSQETCELAKFLHYYTRFKNHENSRSMEEPLLSMAKHKMRVLVSSLPQSEKDMKSTKFIEDSIRELLKARKILSGSYVYGYYLEDTGQSRSIFEFMQNELEEVVERLSEMVGRPYLRTKRSIIIETARLTRRKRHEFSRAVARGFLPPDITHPHTPVYPHTPTQLVKQMKSKASSMYSWPDLELEDQFEVEGRSLSMGLGLSLGIGLNTTGGICSRDGCTYPKDRTASSDYCSVKCSQLDKVYRLNVRRDENTELAIALEMSRLQMIEDQLKMSQKQEQSRPTNRIGTSSVSVQIEATEESLDGVEGTIDKETLTTSSSPSIDMSTLVASERINAPVTVECNTWSNLLDSNLTPSPVPGTEETVVDSFLKSLGKVDLKSLSRTNQSTSWITSQPHNSRRRGEDGRFLISDVHETCVYSQSGRHSHNHGHTHAHGDYMHIEPKLQLMGKSLSTGDLTASSRFEVESIRWRQHRSEVRVKIDRAGNNEFTSLHSSPPHSASYSRHHSHVTPPRTCTTTPNRTPSKSSNKNIYFSSCKSSITSPRASTTAPRTSSTPPRTSSTPPRTSSTPPRTSSTPPRTTPPPIPSSTKVDRNGDNCFGIDGVTVDTGGIGSQACKELSNNNSHQTCNSSCISGTSGSNKSHSLSWDKMINHIHVSPVKNNKDLVGVNKERSKDRNVGKQLTIRIFNTCSGSSPGSGSPCLSNLNPNSTTTSRSQPLETTLMKDSYESETGIPRSPTLYISGVSISRSPELGRSPVVRESRSASLGLVRSDPLDTGCLDTCPRQSSSFPCLGHDSDLHVFRFPKSSTDGALSSVLHVQENNLSSDDFHEVLFLLDPSPRGSKRRHRSKKDRPPSQELTSHL